MLEIIRKIPFKFKAKKELMSSALNGDGIERILMKRLVASLNIDMIIETGTYLGSTAYFLSKNFPNIPIVTVESNDAHYQKAREVLSGCGNVKQYLGSSIEVFGGLDWRNVSNPLFYLDAHWGEVFPLGKELEFISARVARAVIVVDDFQIEGRPDYAFGVNHGRDTSFGPKWYGRSPEELPGVSNIGYLKGFIDLTDSVLIRPNYTYQDMCRFNKHPVYKNLIGYVVVIRGYRSSVHADRLRDEPLVKKYYRMQSGDSA